MFYQCFTFLSVLEAYDPAGKGLSSNSRLASGHLDFYQLFENEWKPKYSQSPVNSVSESNLIGPQTPNTSQNTAI